MRPMAGFLGSITQPAISLQDLNMGKKAAILTSCVMEIVLCLLLIEQAIHSSLTPFLWGWSSDIHLQSITMTLFVALMLAGTFTLLALHSKIEGKKSLLGIITLILATAGLGSLILLYIPLPPNIDNILKKQQIDEASYSRLPDCGKVESFAEIGYQFLDMGHAVVTVPTWMHESLNEIPKEAVADCIAQVGSQQISLMQGSIARDEIPIRKMHALLFEANWLDVDDSPPILNLMHAMVCQRKYDPFVRIAPQYYIELRHGVPDFDYYSPEGSERLVAELCAE
jgi:hypothetical protein